MRTRTRILVPAVATALALLVAGPSAAALVDDDDRAVSAGGNGVADCDGGVAEQSLARLNDLPVPLAETGAPTGVPGTVVTFTTPAMDTDQILVTYTAEGRLQGQTGSVVAPVDFLRVVITLDGALLPPSNDLAFTTDAGQGDSTQVCKRVGPGNHVVRAWYELVDQGGNNALTGTLDDQLLHVGIAD
jgi:hypothetical protein